MALTTVKKVGLENIIRNDSNDRVLTATGTSSNLNGEANLTFDGTALLVNKTGGCNIKVNSGGSNVTSIWTTGGTNTSWGTTSNDFATLITNNTERIRIDAAGDLHVGGTARPDPTTSGFIVENNGKDVRWSQGGGTSGTTSSALSIFGGGNSTNVMAATSWGGQISLHNTNNTDGNSNCISFCGSSQLATSFVIGETTSHSSRNGELVFATSNTAAPAERLRISSSGQLSTGAESAPDVSAGGLCLNQGAADTNIFSLKSSDIAHGVTTYDETDTYFSIRKSSGDKGGARIHGFTDAAGGDAALEFQGIINSDSDQTFCPIEFRGCEANGTGVQNIAADRRIVNIKNSDGTRIASFTGTGLTFGNDSAVANALDDYEEGTFTPGINDHAGGYNTQAGWYTKIGRTITINLQISIPNHTTGTGQLRLTSFPFASRDESNYAAIAAIGLEGITITDNRPVVGRIANNMTVCDLFRQVSTSGFASMDRSNLNSGSSMTLYMTITYLT